eukprot:g33051.t1
MVSSSGLSVTIIKLERVQKRFTSMLLGMEGLSYKERVVRMWHELPEDVVDLGIVTTFKRHLDKYMYKKCLEEYGPSASRELAYQIAEQFRVLGKPLGLKDCVVVGGIDMITQALELSRKPHVVIATPGRLADHIQSSNTFNLKKIKFL